jgi:hypothetical protein
MTSLYDGSGEVLEIREINNLVASNDLIESDKEFSGNNSKDVKSSL